MKFRRVATVCALLLPAFLSGRVAAKIINVTTNDTYLKIESAVAGDQVVIAGGTILSAFT